MSMLAVRDLTVSIGPSANPVDIVAGATFAIERGEILGLVGESGSGKSITSLGVMGLLPSPGPRVRLDVRDLVERWRRRERDELGVPVVGAGGSARGIAFAMRPMPGADHGPELELYVK